MGSRASRESRAPQRRVATRTTVHRWMAVVAAVCMFAMPVMAADEAAEGVEADGFWDALTGGTPTLNVRGRIELAKSATLERSEAYTIRTRLGYGTKPWYGVRVYTNFENIAAATEKTYWHQGKPPPPSKTIIADPPTTEINEGFLEINRPDWLGSELKAGRQTIIYDDARFIGDIAWRQNQQTFDAFEGQTSLGLDDFALSYGWIGYVHRIFGGGNSANPASLNFKSNSHVINASYDAIPQANIAAFAYLLDLSNSAAGSVDVNSSQTYGLRLNGAFDVTERFILDYVASYAFQADYADKPNDYAANYVDASLGVKWKGLGRVAAGFEMLGSDDGTQQFLTPVATAHKFNGWADAYLAGGTANGGPTGLRDLYVTVAPQLPWKLKGSLVYHRFWDGEAGTVRGNEIDAIVKRPFGEHLLVLAKGAYFNSATDAFAETDIWRFWLDVVVKF